LSLKTSITETAVKVTESIFCSSIFPKRKKSYTGQEDDPSGCLIYRSNINMF